MFRIPIDYTQQFSILFLVAVGSMLCSCISSIEAKAVPMTRVSCTQISFRNSNLFTPRLSAVSFANSVSMMARRERTSTNQNDIPFYNHLTAETERTFGHNVSMPIRLPQNYSYPPTTLEALRERFGKRRNIWGDWSAAQTRDFYKSHLPWALQGMQCLFFTSTLVCL